MESDFIQSKSITKQTYYVSIYTNRQLNSIKHAPYKYDDFVPLTVYVTFNVSELRLTETSYCNKRSMNLQAQKSSAVLGLQMLYFTKDKDAFSRFVLETCIRNSGLSDLKLIAGYIKSAIYMIRYVQDSKSIMIFFASFLCDYDICKNAMKKKSQSR